MADKDERIAALAKRFQQRNDKEPGGQSEAEPTRRERAHRSFYLDKGIYRQLDSSYKTTAHELYPQDVSKSIFIETCLAYAFDHLEEIKTILRQIGEQGEHK
jgi:hypothetical protein